CARENHSDDWKWGGYYGLDSW
nr:immunoglobulin heavy chain junction region [Macaca mulatta]